MVRYQIRYSEESKRALRDIPGHYRQRIRREIEALADDPIPSRAAPLRGDPACGAAIGRYRIRLDRWRIVYRVSQDEGVVRILRIRRKHGPETYLDIED